MRFNALLLMTAALPAMLTANSIGIGLSTTPVDFSATSGASGMIKVGDCATDCVLDGSDILNAIPFTWSLKSDDELTYTSTATPNVYALSGDTTDFLLTDKRGDSIAGTLTWNTATVGGIAPTLAGKVTSAAASSTVTDLNATLTLGAVDFASNTDTLAKEAIAAFGSLPTSGEVGNLDLLVSCAPETCISATTTAADLLKPSSKVRRHLVAANNDPAGLVESAEISFNGITAVPEPGTLFVMPALFLGGLILRKRQRS
jgi:hypothetical protein